MNKKYDIAAYIWPAYTGDEPRTRIFWQEGIGEWQTVKNSQKKDNGYFWNRKPVWGYVNEADPYVMSMQIDGKTINGNLIRPKMAAGKDSLYVEIEIGR